MDDQMETDITKLLQSRNSTKAPIEQLQHEKRVAELISNLLQHYWTGDDPPAARQAQIEDWIDDLADWPVDIVEGACREWRRHNTRRPMPAEIIGKCREINTMRNLFVLRPTTPKLYDPGRYDGPEGRCQDRWDSCAARWQARGFICQASCRERIPGYTENPVNPENAGQITHS